jgi:hypothetical protein
MTKYYVHRGEILKFYYKVDGEGTLMHLNVRLQWVRLPSSIYSLSNLYGLVDTTSLEILLATGTVDD